MKWIKDALRWAGDIISMIIFLVLAIVLVVYIINAILDGVFVLLSAVLTLLLVPVTCFLLWFLLSSFSCWLIKNLTWKSLRERGSASLEKNITQIKDTGCIFLLLLSWAVPINAAIYAESRFKFFSKTLGLAKLLPEETLMTLPFPVPYLLLAWIIASLYLIAMRKYPRFKRIRVLS